jgi:uncharacterized protein (TIGR02145 family)
MRHFLFSVLSFALFLVACGDDSSSVSAGNPSSEIASSSSIVSDDSKESSDSKSNAVASSSSNEQTEPSNEQTENMPSGTYDCSKYKCFTTEFLNQDLLEAGKYGEILDERDSQVYKTTQIGNQIWMAQNLNLETQNSRCYNNDSSLCNKYGRLYNWMETVDKPWSECDLTTSCSLPSIVQGICPVGWHVPTKEEYETLIEFAGGFSSSQNLKTTDGWNEISVSNDTYGFSALPAGERNCIDPCHYEGEKETTAFWTSTENHTSNVYFMFMKDSYGDASLSDNPKKTDWLLSVRCVKDAE